MKNSKIITLLFLVLSNFLWANTAIDTLKIKRLKNHVSSLDYITRQIDNSKYYLTLNKSYCDSILAIKKIESEDISIYITDQIKKRIEIGKNILNLND